MNKKTERSLKEMAYVSFVTSLGDKISNLRKDLLGGKIDLEDLKKYSDDFVALARIIIYNDPEDNDLNIDNIRDFIYLCLDYYTFTDGVLIADYDYDMVMKTFITMGGEFISTADALKNSPERTMWDIIPHECSEMVGTVKKCYTPEEFMVYWRKYCDIYDWIIGPKYDGISAVIKIKNEKIERAWTRYDGINGQDITEVVIRAKNAHNFFYDSCIEYQTDGFYKVELCVGNEEFEKLILEKPYSNRRSATSGIVNSPKNLHLAKYITIIPLAYKASNGLLSYLPLGYTMIERAGSPEYLLKRIYEVLDHCKSEKFQFRYDGVVVFPLGNIRYDDENIMNDAMAYKVNTKIGYTKIKRLYVSVGRAGKAVPMVEVYPVECNETRVTDVSLGSFDKAVGYGFRENEEVGVYSAGDVIPQIMIPEERKYPKGASKILIKLKCPYCNEPLTRKGREMFCTNDECIRIITGRITNFVQKIGMENISDATIEDMVNWGLIENIPDIFYLTEEDILKMDGYAVISAGNIIDEIYRIKDSVIPVDKFFGALGIPDVAEKTCRKIFSVIEIKDIIKACASSNWDKLFLKIQVPGVGDKIARSFIKYVKENYDMIHELLDTLEIVESPSYKGSICFTGFRSQELERLIKRAGYDVSDTITSNTTALLVNGSDRSSGKCIKAKKYEVPIIDSTKAYLLITYLNDNLDISELVDTKDII